MMDASTKVVFAEIHARRGAIGEQIAALRKEDAELEVALKVLREIYKLDAPSPSNRDLSTDGEPSPEAGPKAEASLAGTGTGMLSGREGHHGEGGAQTSEAVATEGRRSASPTQTMVDAATLPPVTEKQALVFRAIVKLSQSGRGKSLKTIANEIGAKHEANITGFVRALEQAGYIENRGSARQSDWHPIAFGAPSIRTSRLRRISRRRFTDHAEPDPDSVRGLKADNPAVVEGRTMFPSTVIDPADSPALLVSGANSRKLGDRVTKGLWAGFPIFQLSLEERATCPKTCHHWLTCYGNGMPQARRHRHGPELLDYLRAELTDLQEDHAGGFVVRLHVLGDFYSLDYVRAWEGFLDTFPALHIFGYTAWPKDSEIGAAIFRLTETRWDRFAVRFSSAEVEPQGATALWRKPEDLTDWPGIICPAQTGKTDCCGTCGLCWAVSAKDKTIGFIAHGRVGAPKKAAPVHHPSKDTLSSDAKGLLAIPAKPKPKIAGPMTTVVRRVSGMDPNFASRAPATPKPNKADFDAAKAIADYVATKGVRRMESGASGQTYNMVDWLRIHCGIEARPTKHGSRPVWQIGRRKYSLAEFYIFVNEQRKRKGLEALTVAA
jgi:hypothetical protein